LKICHRSEPLNPSHLVAAYDHKALIRRERLRLGREVFDKVPADKSTEVSDKNNSRVALGGREHNAGKGDLFASAIAHQQRRCLRPVE